MCFRLMDLRTALALALLFTVPGYAGQEGKPPIEMSPDDNSLITSSMRGCDMDIRAHCPGPDQNATKRFMCLMAYEDQLSPACRKGVLETAMTIKAGSEAIDYSLSACETDVDAYCRDVQPGEGRVIGCIKANESSISKACMAALKDTGLLERDR